MTAPSTNSELRMRIGRSRRRIDGRLRAVAREGRRAASWRTVVARYPAQSLLAALGAGFAASAGVRRGRWIRWLGTFAMRRSAAEIFARFREEFAALWPEREGL